MVMIVSMMFAVLIGFSAGLGCGVAAMVCLTPQCDNLRRFIIACRRYRRQCRDRPPRGDLAVHAMLGYGGGFVGPLVLGVILDTLGGETVMN